MRYSITGSDGKICGPQLQVDVDNDLLQHFGQTMTESVVKWKPLQLAERLQLTRWRDPAFLFDKYRASQLELLDMSAVELSYDFV
ncbi:hypothetical protein JCM10207_005549 [Rhodosporidiobolus poonsookiae]